MKQRLLDEMKDIVTEGGLENFEAEVNEKLAEWSQEGFECSPVTLAAAFIKKIISRPATSDRRSNDSRDRRDGGVNPNDSDMKFKDNPDGQRFFINIGSKDELTSTLLMEFIADNTSAQKSDFSDSYVKETFSFFELPKTLSDEVLNALNGKKYSGREVHVELSEKRSKTSRPAFGGGNRGGNSGYGGGYGDRRSSNSGSSNSNYGGGNRGGNRSSFGGRGR